MADTDLKQIGERISKRRKLMGWTQEQLAEKMDVSIQMISNLERGVKAVRIENLIKLSRLLNVTADYILTGYQSSGDIDVLAEQIHRLSGDQQELIAVIVSHYLHNGQ